MMFWTHLLTSDNGFPPSYQEVNEILTAKAREGYVLKHITTGGFAVPLCYALQGTGNTYSGDAGAKEQQFDMSMCSDTKSDIDYTAWVYLIFEREPTAEEVDAHYYST